MTTEQPKKKTKIGKLLKFGGKIIKNFAHANPVVGTVITAVEQAIANDNIPTDTTAEKIVGTAKAFTGWHLFRIVIGCGVAYLAYAGAKKLGVTPEDLIDKVVYILQYI